MKKNIASFLTFVLIYNLIPTYSLKVDGILFNVNQSLESNS